QSLFALAVEENVRLYVHGLLLSCSVIEGLVGPGPEIAGYARRNWRLHQELGHQDADHVLARIEMGRRAVAAVPAEPAGRGEDVGAARHHRATHAPARAMAE